MATNPDSEHVTDLINAPAQSLRPTIEIANARIGVEEIHQEIQARR